MMALDRTTSLNSKSKNSVGSSRSVDRATSTNSSPTKSSLKAGATFSDTQRKSLLKRDVVDKGDVIHRYSQSKSESTSRERLRDAGAVERFVKSTYFEFVAGVFIIINCCCLAAGVNCANQCSEMVELTLRVMEDLALGVFVIEWSLRMYVLEVAEEFHKTWRKKYMLFPWLDTFLIWGPGVGCTWILPLLKTNVGSTTTLLQSLRSIRFLRLLLVLKSVKPLRPMWLLASGIFATGSTIIGCMLLIYTMCLMMGLLMVELIGRRVGLTDDMEYDPNSIGHKFRWTRYSIMTVTRFLSNDNAMDVLERLIAEDLTWLCWLNVGLLFFFLALSQYVLINLVTAVIINHSLEIVQADEAEAARGFAAEQKKQMRNLEHVFEQLDTDGSGYISIDEFNSAFDIKECRNKLLILGLSEEELKSLFKVLDDDGAGQLSVAEFSNGMMRLKGQAKSCDMLEASKKVEKLEKFLQSNVAERMPASSGASRFASNLSELPSLRATAQSGKDAAPAPTGPPMEASSYPPGNVLEVIEAFEAITDERLSYMEDRISMAWESVDAITQVIRVRKEEAARLAAQGSVPLLLGTDSLADVDNDDATDREPVFLEGEPQLSKKDNKDKKPKKARSSRSKDSTPLSHLSHAQAGGVPTERKKRHSKRRAGNESTPLSHSSNAQAGGVPTERKKRHHKAPAGAGALGVPLAEGSPEFSPRRGM